MNSLVNKAKELELSEEYGDMAFCLVDADVNPNKDSQVRQADKIAAKTMNACIQGLSTRFKRQVKMPRDSNRKLFLQGRLYILINFSQVRKHIRLLKS